MASDGVLRISASFHRGDHLAADQGDRVEVAVEEMLAHDPGQAGLLQLAQLVEGLGNGSGDRALRQPGQECPTVAVLAFPAREGGGAVDQVLAVGADQPAGHHRERQVRRVPALGFAGPVEPLAHRGDLRRGRHHGVVLVGEAGGEAEAARSSPAADDQRRVRLLDRLRQSVEVPGAEVLTLEGERALAPVAEDHLHLLLERLHPRADLGQVEAVELVLGLHQPAPIPTSTRPPETWSAVTAAFASTAGWRKVAGETIVPRRSFTVVALSAVIVPQASSEPRSRRSSTDR